MINDIGRTVNVFFKHKQSPDQCVSLFRLLNVSVKAPGSRHTVLFFSRELQLRTPTCLLRGSSAISLQFVLFDP